MSLKLYFLSIGDFYYTMLDLQVYVSVHLPSIQLIGVAKAEDIHAYRFDTLLEPFINDTGMMLLGQVL